MAKTLNSSDSFLQTKSWYYCFRGLKHQFVDNDVRVFIPGISSNHDDLLLIWEDYLINCSHQGENPVIDAKVDLEDFILRYDELSILIKNLLQA